MEARSSAQQPARLRLRTLLPRARLLGRTTFFPEAQPADTLSEDRAPSPAVALAEASAQGHPRGDQDSGLSPFLSPPPWTGGLRGAGGGWVPGLDQLRKGHRLYPTSIAWAHLAVGETWVLSPSHTHAPPKSEARTWGVISGRPSEKLRSKEGVKEGGRAGLWGTPGEAGKEPTALKGAVGCPALLFWGTSHTSFLGAVSGDRAPRWLPRVFFGGATCLLRVLTVGRAREERIERWRGCPCGRPGRLPSGPGVDFPS